jgi:hypothetical protein
MAGNFPAIFIFDGLVPGPRTRPAAGGTNRRGANLSSRIRRYKWGVNDRPRRTTAGGFGASDREQQQLTVCSVW